MDYQKACAAAPPDGGIKRASTGAIVKRSQTPELRAKHPWERPLTDEEGKATDWAAIDGKGKEIEVAPAARQVPTTVNLEQVETEEQPALKGRRG